MDLHDWLEERSGIAHRTDARDAGYTVGAIREAVRSGRIDAIRRHWIALTSAPSPLRLAATAGGVIGCITLARHRGWWVPESIDPRVHLRLPPNSGRRPRDEDGDLVIHWSRTIAPAPHRALEESVEDALAHIAGCLDPVSALSVWESAIRTERLSADALRQVKWSTRAAADCAAKANGLSDSGLETIAVARLAPLGLPIRQQIVIAGHRVDILIGERLVVQIDGFAHHSTAAQRTRDIAHDAELRLRGYTVLRFSYAQVVHEWRQVERTIARAVANGAHRPT